MRPAASPLAVWAGILVLYVVWGSTYLGIAVAVETIPPFLMGSLRFIPAGVVLALVIALRHRRTIRRPSAVAMRDTTIVGAFLMLGGMGLVAWGEQTIPSGIAALLIGLLPAWLAVFGRVLFGERLPTVVLVGIGIGIVGVAILAWPETGVAGLDPAGLLALLVSPMFWSLGSLYSARRAVLPAPALFATGLQMVMGGLALLVASAAVGELATFDPEEVSARSWLGVLYLLTVGSLVGYTTYAWLLTVAPLSRIATYAYVNPVVAVILGWAFLQEPITPRTIVAAVVIVAAVALIVTARSRGVTVGGREPVPAAGPASPEGAAVLTEHNPGDGAAARIP
jgi:drug/metabolite transporter (DMT)-like permease